MTGVRQMVGVVRRIEEKGRDRLQEEWLCGMRVMAGEVHEPAGMSRARLEHRLARLEQSLLRKGVHRVVLPSDFFRSEALRYLSPVTPLPLYRGAADLLALAWLRRKGTPAGKSCVALSGSRICPELMETARRLCSCVRAIRLDVPGEAGEQLARRLCWEHGIPMVPPTACADLTVSFGGSAHAQLCLFGDAPRLDGLSVAAPNIPLPKGMEDPILTLLWESGRLDRREIQVFECANSRKTLAFSQV